MLSKEEVLAKEEALRKQVRDLPDDQRLSFFKETEKQLKDPDTYATLNYVFIAGLHHFYLGKWGRGIANITIFLIAIIFLFTGNIELGVLVFLLITAFELFELFRSQLIVQNHNNEIMEDLYRKIAKQPPSS
ncbi:TM2 domain-containing protein [Kiloniella laminariae]|uniref:TM2 domain-containing protein n=1 Tax=Kiloniella laminariae TaxID=454162 RepID=A0ABT4LG19_9PROT|nr:TM2 domain-containing protein [Kiloniella laminariae]MCZ4280042.1 TM2 domain-containing protein [Kiloniella laminariae]